MRTWRNGSRARLRIWCLTTWGFESLRAHNFQPGAIRFPAVLTFIPHLAAYASMTH